MLETVRGKLWFVGALVALAIVAFILIDMYDRGYRLSGGRIRFPATIHLYAPAGTAVEFDTKPLSAAPAGSPTIIRTVAGTHTLGTTRDGYWTWAKEVEVPGDVETVFRPFLVPRTTDGDVIPRGEADYATAERALAQATLPSREEPTVSGDGSVAIFVEGNEIKALWQGSTAAPAYFCTKVACDEELSVLAFDAELRALAFLPGRSDVVLFAAQNGVFALELDKRGIQNFQPVYKGIRPSFAIADGVIYMKDATSVFRVRVE